MKRFGLSATALISTLVVALALSPQSATAQEVKAKVGEAAPNFELPDVRTGETVSLASFRGDKIVVMTFQSMNCPWDSKNEGKGYQPILSALSQEYAPQDVQFIAINSNQGEAVEALASHADARGIPYPLLKDEGNRIADVYGGRTTPHFYVIDKEGVLRYKGGFEKVPSNPDQVGQMDEPYLVPVINAVLAGNEVPYTETQSKGCTINRARR